MAPRLPRLPLDPFLVMLAATVALAALLPAHGAGAAVLGQATTAAVAMLFFLYGTRLAPRNLLEGLLHWRLQALIFAATYLLFPLLGLVTMATVGAFVPPALALGLMFICVLPSTVQSSIAFTSIARGNVPAALCAATLSNLAGMVLTPLLTALLLRAGHGGFSAGALSDIALHLLLPFAAGQAVRPFAGRWLQRHKALTGLVDRGSILLVVYGAFSEGMVAGIWGQITPGVLVTILLLDAVLLAAVLGATLLASRALGLCRADEVVAVFCGSKKSIASGIPMANILFPGDVVSMIVLPVMLFHQIQLFVCATLARRYAQRMEPEAVPVLAPAE
ncbi:bile acid:sodium symporter family protein [Roseomonas sp. E05]|uniref:bile acid:sodium symporter family protein n=1 Tax=Roseomonas sp. E05 TaxID=3046310 RepID=UPI0024B92F9B|nr:bile acid:sodium symporter family protein [Roseomonas sp. E05]MDJ0387225.1 bile acid:sodium symporter family protein [Roseomonas sp. E05]